MTSLLEASGTYPAKINPGPEPLSGHLAIAPVRSCPPTPLLSQYFVLSEKKELMLA